MPWMSASTRSIQSHVRQSGLAQRVATNPKFTRPTPLSCTCMISTCPTARISSRIPEIRMNSQLQSSKPPTGRSRPPRKSRWGVRSGGCASRRGSVAVAISVPDQVDDLAAHDPRDGDHGGDEYDERDDAHHADVLREAGEEVDQQDLDPVERVVEHGGDQPELEQPDDRVLVQPDHAVVRVGSPANHGGIDHMGEQEQDDRDARDAVEQPGVLTFMALVDGAVVALLLARSRRHVGSLPGYLADTA